MTTPRQKAANRHNSAKSTGPRSREGRARSATNARRHGLTSAPDHGEVLRWFRVILDDSGAVPDPSETAQDRRAAWRLAESEARLARARQAETAHVARMLSWHRKLGRRSFLELADMEMDDPDVLAGLAGHPDLFVAKAASILLHACENTPPALRNRLRLLGRYRREAERARDRAYDA